MSGFGHADPREIHMDVFMPPLPMLPAGSFIRVVLSSDGVNEGFTARAYLNNGPVDVKIILEDDEDD